MIKSPPKVMTFSATDPTGGAGLQADILTISSLGCHPVSIATGFTVQDTIGVNKLISIGCALNLEWLLLMMIIQCRLPPQQELK